VRLSWVSAGLTVGVVAMVLQVVSFPVVTTGGGLLGTGDDSNAALYLLFHLSLAAGAAAGALSAPMRWRIPSVVAGWVVALLLALDLVPLPELLRGGVSFTPLLVVLELVLAGLVAGTTALWVLRAGRSAVVPYGWIGVALSLSVYDLLLNGVEAERYGAVWWASLSLRVATYLTLAFGPLVAVLRQLRDSETYSENELDRRESQLRSSLSVTASLLSSAEGLSRAVTSAQVADLLSSSARSASQAPYAFVVVGRKEEPLRLVGADGYTPAMRTELAKVDWDGLSPGPLGVGGAPLFLESRSEIEQRSPRVAGLPKGRAAALARLPITVGQNVIGVLTVWDEHPREWSSIQRRLLAGLAAQGGQAIARAQAYEEQAAAARTLQSSLLPPRLPQPKRLDLAARYVPAQDGVLVGGDWYDCLVLDDDRVALVVGDVMGKGLHAAAQMGQIRMAVRSVAGLDPSPAAVLTALDDLNIELGDDEIVTMTYVLVDPVRGVARVARAGHLPPLLVHPYGAVQSIEEGGSAPLGASFGQPRVESSFTLPIGSLLVLYTDGLVEDRATGLDRGMPELTMALAAMAPYRQPMGDLAARLLEECTVDRGGDDIALLVARYG
jgi:serine phosphatase RsbU (regulator of sigma subunit)